MAPAVHPLTNCQENARYSMITGRALIAGVVTTFGRSVAAVRTADAAEPSGMRAGFSGCIRGSYQSTPASSSGDITRVRPLPSTA